MKKIEGRKSGRIRAAAGILLLLAVGRRTEAAVISGGTAGDSGAVTVCILDSGCGDPGAEGRNYLGEPEDLSDPAMHGTLVYRILREKAPDAKLLALKCFDSTEMLQYDGNSEEGMQKGDGSAYREETAGTVDGAGETEAAVRREEPETGAGEEAPDAVMARAVRDAVDVYHADLINLSWAGTRDSDELHEAVRYAAERGAVLVAAAGNLSLSTPLGSEIYPAAWDEVIGVSGAEREEDGELVSSLWYLHSSAVFVCADPSAGVDGNEEPVKGTSFATPRVTAVLARYLENAGNTWDTGDGDAGPARPVPDGSGNTDAAGEYLKSIAEDAGEPGYDTTFGWGYIE